MVLHQSDYSLKLEVRLDGDNIWLKHSQLSELFDCDVKTIGKHLKNALKEELENVPVVSKFETTAADGKFNLTEHNNLDMVMSVGFRVKSRRGVDFRNWVKTILKEHMIKGYAINTCSEQLEKAVALHSKKIDFFVSTPQPLMKGIFFDGHILDAYKFVTDLIRSAQKSLLLIDEYVDESVLLMLANRNPDVMATVCTKKITTQLQFDIDKHNDQYPPINIRTYKNVHDRFLIIDDKEVYHIGASLKDLGKKMFAFSKLEIEPGLLIDKL